MDVSEFVESNEESQELLSSLRQSESVATIEQIKIHNDLIEPSDELIEELA